MAKKWWKTVARHAPERLRPSLQGSRPARVRWGASGSCPGAFRGAFGAPKSALGGPLSDRFGGMFDFKAGFWHCAAHATAEDTESDETCSTLSTNALDVRYFFPGSAHVASGQEIRRPWGGVWGGASEWVL